MPLIVKYFCLIGLVLFMEHATAARLGALHVYSSAGEPLDAEIVVLSLPDPGSFTARIASADAYRASNLRYDGRLAQGRVTLKKDARGRLHLRVTTPTALDQPALDLLVETSTAQETSIARYTVELKAGASATAALNVPARAPAPAQVQALRTFEPKAVELTAYTDPPGRVTPRPTTAAAAPAPHAPASAAALPQQQALPVSRLDLRTRGTTDRPAESHDAIPGPPIRPPAVPRPLASERPTPGRERVLAVPQVAVKPTLDGALEEPAWKSAVVSDHFWISEQQRWPSEQTEVLVMADREYLYVGFRVYDSQREAIQAIQTRRGAGLGLDDQVAVELDPFLSYREISSYSINANGVQDDAIAGGRARQLAWKGDWHGAAMRTPYGWSAEIAIPFSMLNYERGAAAFGVNFLRYHHRTAEWSRWADITVRSLPEEMGRLTGLQLPTVAKPQPWTFMPYALLGRNTPDKRGNTHHTLFNTGAEIRYQPRPNLTGLVSINPDFSQIESAITNINFNYNEKFRADPRPFFQEGSAYFGNTRGYFYSNRVPDFDLGGKFFTRAGGYQVGALATRAPDDRTDFVFRGEREFDATHSLGAMIVSTHRRNLDNSLYVVRGQGREASGFTYSGDIAWTSTGKQAGGEGSKLAGTLGWNHHHWTLGVGADSYSDQYLPANGLIERDLLGTRGVTPYVSYYRDLGEGPVRELKGDLSYIERHTADGRVQRRTWYTGGTVELRQEVRVGLWYSDGIYRPVRGAPDIWSNTMSHDYYWTRALDFGTRSSRLGYGISNSSGELGGEDYEYTSVYAWGRPTVTTFINLTSERLENFGKFDQTIVSAGWDITPRQSIVGRYITAFYGDGYRLAYSLNVRRNVDFFLVYDHEPAQLARLSAKVVMTLQ